MNIVHYMVSLCGLPLLNNDQKMILFQNRVRNQNKRRLPSRKKRDNAGYPINTATLDREPTKLVLNDVDLSDESKKKNIESGTQVLNHSNMTSLLSPSTDEEDLFTVCNPNTHPDTSIDSQYIIIDLINMFKKLYWRICLVQLCNIQVLRIFRIDLITSNIKRYKIKTAYKYFPRNSFAFQRKPIMHKIKVILNLKINIIFFFDKSIAV